MAKTKSQLRSPWNLVGMFFCFVLISALCIHCRKTHSLTSFFLAVPLWLVPIFLVGLRSWNRWLHPLRLPTRWRADSLQEARLTRVWLALLSVFVVFSAIHTFGHFNEAHAYQGKLLGVIGLGAQAWGVILMMYINDRKHIPQDVGFTHGWSEVSQGIHSEHWGKHRTPESESPQI